MIETHFVARLVKELYNIVPAEIEPLMQFSYDWRGIYCLEDPDEQKWVLRLVRKQKYPAGFQAPAVLLPWLAQAGYPAPKVKPTNLGTTIGEYAGWRALLTKFVPGELASPSPENVRLIGTTLGQLHQLTVPTANAQPAIPESQWHPRRLTRSAFQHPDEIADQLPGELLYLYRGAYQTQETVCRMASQVPLHIIHGDCWYGNAVLTAPDQIVFIDWDMAGLGPALLDLGELLLTSHYDAANLLTVEPDEALIYAIMAGYCEQRCPSALERGAILEAVRFLLVYSSSWFLEQAQGNWQESIEVQKLRVRYAATERIAQIVETYLEQIGQPII